MTVTHNYDRYTQLWTLITLITLVTLMTLTTLITLALTWCHSWVLWTPASKLCYGWDEKVVYYPSNWPDLCSNLSDPSQPCYLSTIRWFWWVLSIIVVFLVTLPANSVFLQLCQQTQCSCSSASNHPSYSSNNSYILLAIILTLIPLTCNLSNSYIL
jgi:hypothetical protein